MAYRRNYRNYSKPTPRNLTVKYSGPCACCGATIKAGEIATYYPAGTIAGRTDGSLSHIGGLEGNSQRCAGILRANVEDTQLASFIAEGLGEW